MFLFISSLHAMLYQLTKTIWILLNKQKSERKRIFTDRGWYYNLDSTFVRFRLFFCLSSSLAYRTYITCLLHTLSCNGSFVIFWSQISTVARFVVGLFQTWLGEKFVFGLFCFFSSWINSNEKKGNVCNGCPVGVILLIFYLVYNTKGWYFFILLFF